MKIGITLFGDPNHDPVVYGWMRQHGDDGCLSSCFAWHVLKLTVIPLPQLPRERGAQWAYVLLDAETAAETLAKLVTTHGVRAQANRAARRRAEKQERWERVTPHVTPVHGFFPLASVVEEQFGRDTDHLAFLNEPGLTEWYARGAER